MRRLIIGLALLSLPSTAQAQAPHGHASVFADYLPNRNDTIELRTRFFVEEVLEPGSGLRLTLSGFVEGLLARRPPEMAGPIVEPGSRSQRVSAGVARVQDAKVEITRGRLDLTAGFARVVWGRLDELQPTDVVNPLDVSRFFFEGRSEARLPVALVRARAFLTQDAVVEGIYVPAFRRGRFDLLDEDSSPFNIVAIGGAEAVCHGGQCPPGGIEVVERRPALTAGSAQGGARISMTSGRTDWSVAAFRGFEPFALYRLSAPTSPGVVSVEGLHPRFLMFGGDVETVRGEWGVRGEIAAFVEDTFQSADLRLVSGDSFEAGAGVDRRAGDYTISGSVLFQAEDYDVPLVDPDGATAERRTDVSVIVSADRTFARERFRARAFAVYNTTDASAFVRGIGSATLRDNVSLETSLGWFMGRGQSLTGRFADTDFSYVRLKYHF